jgi:hypothetical protein
VRGDHCEDIDIFRRSVKIAGREVAVLLTMGIPSSVTSPTTFRRDDELTLPKCSVMSRKLSKRRPPRMVSKAAGQHAKLETAHTHAHARTPWYVPRSTYRYKRYLTGKKTPGVLYRYLTGS